VSHNDEQDFWEDEQDFWEDEQDFLGEDLSEYNFSGANLSQKNFTGANLKGANLSGAILTEATFVNADLTGANLESADLSKANLWNAKLGHANLNCAVLKDAYQYDPFLDFCENEPYLHGDISKLKSDIVLTQANLREADLTNADLSRAILRSADLRYANLANADLRGANLDSAKLRDATLEDANLDNACLDDAELLDANLEGVNLSNAQLIFADLRGARLCKANLDGADLRWADLTGTNLRDVYWGNANLEYTKKDSSLALVRDRSDSRIRLIEALNEAEERLIIVCPWLSDYGINSELLQKFQTLLEREVYIDIGWGNLLDISKFSRKQQPVSRTALKSMKSSWKYKGLSELEKLERTFPERFTLKLLGTHEKYFVCDRKFAVVGSHNMLTSSSQGQEREIGLWTDESYIIDALIERFINASNLEHKK
jgi:uncharacterized protein YjbI with pentapeptide repeats